ncbi:MAG TPA: hypothetical protein VGG27_20500 [Magnetospirillaceae bacterium]|jgi:hypothetical protein
MKKIVVVLFAAMLAACAYKHQPIYSPSDMIPPNAQQLAPAQIEAAITSGAVADEWKVQRVDTGHLVATHEKDRHSATVDIFFDQKSWRIAYKASSELDADPSKETIHSHYNVWIRNLERAIAARLNEAK